MPDCDNNTESLAEQLAKFDVSEDDRPSKSAQAFVINVEEEEVKPTQQGGETDEQMIKKKETVILMSLKRRAEQEAKRAIKQNELAQQREQLAMKQRLQEFRKLEHKQRREAIFEQYKQKKKAAEAAERDGPSLGERSSHGGSANNLSTQPKAGPRSIKSAHHVSVWTLYTGPKLFAKPTTKTNLTIIQNAIVKALEGAANAKTLKKMQDTISAHSKTCGHFLILFRNRHQFRGLYEYNQKENSITKLDGFGPKVITSESISKYYKYDSPKRQFVEVQTKHISLTIIGFSIQCVF